jgi:cyclase
LDWILKVQNLGAGELLVNSIDADGTKSGFDIQLLGMISRVATVPVIASGGAGSAEHFVEAAATGVDALLAASIFHQREVSLAEVKSALAHASVYVRGAA